MPASRARSAKKRPAGRKRRGVGAKLALALVACAALALAGMYAHSRIVHVRYAGVSLSDLPAALDGLKILFVSDIDVRGEADANAAANAMDALAALEPDVLLLGGDYTGPGLWDALNGRETGDALSLQAARRAFFRALSDFPAPLGKYAVRAEDDPGSEALASELELGGVTLLDGQLAQLSRGGQSLYVAGLSPDTDAGALASGVSADACVIAFAHSPDSFAGALTAEAQGGGAWADVVLCGGTHGGQVRLGERTLLSLSERERQYLSGWRKEGGVFLLTSQGLGCEVVSLRLGTRAEAHLITLRCAQGAVGGA